MVFDEKSVAASSSTSRRTNASRPTEDTPLIGKPPPPLSSQPKTFANVFIAIVGAGVLGLPYAFKRTGWLMGLLILFSIAALTYYCMMLLVHTRRRLESSENGFANVTSFGDLGFAVCGPIGRFVVDVLVTLSQAGFCVGYLIFIADTMTHFFEEEASMSWGPSLGSTLFTGRSLYIWGCLPFELALNSIATLTHLAPLSIFADVVDLGAMGVVVVDDILVILKQASEVTAFGGLSVFFYGVGVAVYSFEGIGMALPLESEMKDTHKFGRILGLSMTFIALMYGSFGALGYFAYGKFTKDIITSNMGAGVVTRLVQLGLCINLFFTFPLMMNPVYEIVERRFSSGRYCLWLRWLLVLLVSLVALLVPNFADFLSLVGSSVCCSLGFVLPTLFHLLVFKDELEWHQCAVDILIGIMGVIFAVTGTFYSLVEIFSVKV